MERCLSACDRTPVCIRQWPDSDLPETGELIEIAIAVDGGGYPPARSSEMERHNSGSIGVPKSSRTEYFMKSGANLRNRMVPLLHDASY